MPNLFFFYFYLTGLIKNRHASLFAPFFNSHSALLLFFISFDWVLWVIVVMWIFYCWYCRCYCLHGAEFHKKKTSFLSGFWLAEFWQVLTPGRQALRLPESSVFPGLALRSSFSLAAQCWLEEAAAQCPQEVSACLGEEDTLQRSQAAHSVLYCEKRRFSPSFPTWYKWKQKKVTFWSNHDFTFTRNTEP